MADNITAGTQTGSGPVLATDQRSSDSAHFPFGKLVFGPLDTFTLVSVTDGLPVQPATASAWVLGAGSAAIGSVTVTSIVPGVAATSLGKAEDAAHASGDTGVFVLAVRNDTPGALAGADGDYAPIQVNAAGAVRVDGSQVTQPISNGFLTSMAGEYAANAAIPVAVTGTVNPGNVPNTSPWLFTERPATSGGLSMSKTISAANTNATSVKGSAGQVYGLQVFNINAAARYLKLYNKASAPTVGTDTPVKVITIPGNTAGAGAVIPFDLGLAFATGIAFALTTGAADNDTGAVAAAELIVNIDYK